MKRILLLFILLFAMLIPQPVMADDYADWLVVNGYNPEEILDTYYEGIGQSTANWTIIFNPTGTHFKDGYLKIRLDIYPPEGTKAYEVHYVEHFDEKENSLGWWLNPALNHFITVPHDITIEQLDTYITKLDVEFLATLDLIWDGYKNDTLIKPVADYISPLMRDLIYSTIKLDITPPVLQEYFIDQVNTRFIDYAVVNDGAGGIAQVINPQSIDVGSAAINRGTHYDCNGYTLFSDDNPANADGTIDTVEVWLQSASDQLDVGTIYAASDWSSRDYENVGACASGSMQQFTGLDIDILTGDYIGLNSPGDYAAVERDDTAACSYYRASGVTFPFTDESASQTASRIISLYGTGEESGGTYDIVNIPISEALGILEPNTTYYAFGSAPSNPVEDGECTFTVNNTGSVAANVTIKCTNFTGGVGWTLTSDSPGENTVRITAYYSGQNPASGVVLTTSEQDFCTVNASGSLMWDFKIETGTFTDGVLKTANITLTSYEL